MHILKTFVQYYISYRHLRKYHIWHRPAKWLKVTKTLLMASYCRAYWPHVDIDTPRSEQTSADDIAADDISKHIFFAVNINFVYQDQVTLKRKSLHFDEMFITGCTGSCQNDNFQCSQWWKFRQNDDIFVSVLIEMDSLVSHWTMIALQHSMESCLWQAIA